MAIDGTKIKANASKHKAMSHKRMLERKDEYTKAIKEWFDRADREDDDDDRRLGADKRGDELPDHLRTKQKRLEKINEALEALKREAEEQAAEDGKDPAETRVADKAQKNFTDPDSKILQDGRRIRPGIQRPSRRRHREPGHRCARHLRGRQRPAPSRRDGGEGR